MDDIDIRIVGRAGRITFTRAQALNAMTYDMCLAIDAALRRWHDDASVDLVVIDADGDKAFCAGGDIADLYATGRAGDFDWGRTFWRDEYRLNAYLAEYPKPVISFMQGFVMGGGVGIGCHASIRVVDDTTRIAMPECGIGLVPDVGGSYLLARAPGHLGEYLGMTGARMGPDDAIFAGFGDTYIPRARWGELIEQLQTSGEISHIAKSSAKPPPGAMRGQLEQINRLFAPQDLNAIRTTLEESTTDFARDTLKSISRNAPLSMACAMKIIRTLRASAPDIRTALALEYRFTWRAMQWGDFLEGIRAQIIDKDRTPAWKYANTTVPESAIDHMLDSLEDAALTF